MEYKVHQDDDIHHYAELDLLIVDFYTLDQILNYIESSDIDLCKRRYIAKIYLDSYFLLKDLSTKLSRLIFDYLALASIGEARYYEREGSISELNSLIGQSGTERITSQMRGIYFDPHSFLPKLEKLFRFNSWPGGYGGEKWADICKNAALYSKIPDIVYIDHIINITHNGGTAFDKGVLIRISQPSTFRRFLDIRARYEDFLNNDYYYDTGTKIPRMTTEVYKLFSKLINIGGILPYGYAPHVNRFDFNHVLIPLPVKWGRHLLGKIETTKSDRSIMNGDVRLKLIGETTRFITQELNLLEKVNKRKEVLNSILSNIPNLITEMYSNLENYITSNKLEVEELEYDVGFSSENFFDIPPETIVMCAQRELCESNYKCRFKIPRFREFHPNFPGFCYKINQIPEVEVFEEKFVCCSHKNKCNKTQCNLHKKYMPDYYNSSGFPFLCYYTNKVITLTLWFEDSEVKEDIDELVKELDFITVTSPQDNEEELIILDDKIKVTVKEDSR